MPTDDERIEIGTHARRPHTRLVDGHLLVIDPVVARDPNRFKQFAPEPRAVIPADAAGELEYVPTRVLIDERIRRLMAEAGDTN